MARKRKSKLPEPDEQLQELLRMRMEITAMRRRMNEDFTAMLAQIEKLLPEEQPRRKITDWKKHTANW